jgi:hypothetical protein
MAQVVFGGLLELAEDHRGDFRRRVGLVANADLHQLAWPSHDLIRDELFLRLHFVVTPTHETLDGVDRTFRVGDRLAFRGVPHQDVAFIGKSHDAGRQAVPLLIGDDLDLAPLHHRYHGVRRAQVNPDDFFLCHRLSSFLRVGA